MEVRITIPDDRATRVIDALCVRYGFDAAGGQTKLQFVRDLLRRWIRDEVRDHEIQMAMVTAQQTTPPVDL